MSQSQQQAHGFAQEMQELGLMPNSRVSYAQERKRMRAEDRAAAVAAAAAAEKTKTHAADGEDREVERASDVGDAARGRSKQGKNVHGEKSEDGDSDTETVVMVVADQVRYLAPPFPPPSSSSRDSTKKRESACTDALVPCA